MKKDIKKTITMSNLYNLVEDKETDHFILFLQIMEHLDAVNHKKYLKVLKKIGDEVDEARSNYGIKY